MELPLLVNMARFCAWLLTNYFETSVISVPEGQRERLRAWASASSRCVAPAPKPMWIEVAQRRGLRPSTHVLRQMTRRAKAVVYEKPGRLRHKARPGRESSTPVIF
jgi:hypothetical protein